MLKKVRVKFEFVIVAKPGDDLASKARECISDAVDDMSNDEFTIITHDYKDGDVPGWDGDCIPYGGDGKKTIREHDVES